MKKLLKITFGLIAALVIVAVVAASLVDINSFKPQIIAQAEKALGRKVTMDGDISLRILPTIAIKTGKVTISNPQWAGGGDMLSANSISFGAELMPLFSNQLTINSLEIIEPKMLLVKKGTLANWQFEHSGAKAPEPQHEKGGESQSLSLSVKHVYLSNGDVTFKDLSAGTMQRVQTLNIKLTSPDVEKSVFVEASAKLNGEEVTLKTNIGTPLKMLAGARSALDANVSFGKLGGIFKGTVQLGKVPSIKGSLASDSINLNDWIKESKAAHAQSAAPAGNWSNAPIDLSALSSVNADLDVVIGEFIFKKLTIKPLKTQLTLAGGKLDFAINVAQTYGGKINANIKATFGGAVALSGNVAGVEAEPFLSDWANNDTISGTLNSAFNLKAQGKSQRAMVESLGGSANFTFQNGAIKGKNLAANIRKLKSLGGNADASAPQQTDFSEISGSMNIASGIIRNNDLFMKSPLIRLRGEGEVNLPAYQIAYKLKPEIVGTLKGQGGKDDAAGVTVPLKISGNLNAPSYSIDAKAALMENLTPQKIGAMKDNVKALKEQYKEGGGLEGLKGLLGR